MPETLLEIGNILNWLLNQAGISEAELARKINVPRATINRLTSGRTPDPRASTLSAIAHYFNVSVDQLLGKQPLYLNDNQNMLQTKHTSIPIIDLKETKNWSTLITKLKPAEHFDWIMIDPSIEEGQFGLRVKGESMWPQFQENSILILDPKKEAKNRDFVIAHINKNDEIIFRQLIIEDNYRFLKAINNIFPTVQLDDQDKIIGIVIQTRKSYG